MGPLSEDGGNTLESLSSVLPRLVLQWGRRPRTAEITCPVPSRGQSSSGFNGAAVRGRRKSNESSSRLAMRRLGLQWGRRPRTAEMELSTMRSPMRRQLQWGRRPRTAEIRSGGRNRSATNRMLQWGRRPRTAEISRTHRARRRYPRFNGAAVRGRRKFHLDTKRPSSLCSFNGAAVRGRRKSPRKSTAARSSGCFNGAAVRGRRKFLIDAWADVGRAASMGPPSEDGGNERFDSMCLRLGQLASMGPPSEDGGNSHRRPGSSKVACASMGPPSEDGGNL